MSENDLLTKLNENDVFIHTQLPIYDIPHLYEPFQKITTNKVEEKIKRNITQNHFFVVQSDTGSGKTSAVNYCLLELDDDYFPIILSPFTENVSDVCGSIEGFTRFVLHSTLTGIQRFNTLNSTAKKEAKEALSLTRSYVESQKSGIRGRIRGAFSIIPFIAKVDAEVGSDIENYTQTSLTDKTFNTERIGAISNLCGIIESHGLKPIFYFDDTDKFLKREDHDLSGIIPKFFNEIMVGIRNIDRPIILAAHTFYESAAAYQNAKTNLFDEIIKIPKLDQNGCKVLINKRIKAVSDISDISNAFDDEAISRLMDYYETNQKIRDLIGVCKDSVARTTGINSKISKGIIELSISDKGE